MGGALAVWPALAPARMAAGTGATAGCTATSSTAAAVGQCAPSFALADTNGRTVQLTHFRGHPVLLNFWGVGCDQCALELPDLKRFAGTFTRHGGVVLGVNTWGEPPSLIADYARTRGVTWPLLPNPPGDVGSLYGVRGTPTNVFIDRHGVIRAIAVGPQTQAQFQDQVQGLSL
jgi:peroxiredoxin